MSGTAVPDWFVSLTALGRAAASEKNSQVGDSYPVTVLSVPTGQFVVWALTNGAFSAAPKVEPQLLSRLCALDGIKTVNKSMM